MRTAARSALARPTSGLLGPAAPRNSARASRRWRSAAAHASSCSCRAPASSPRATSHSPQLFSSLPRDGVARLAPVLQLQGVAEQAPGPAELASPAQLVGHVRERPAQVPLVEPRGRDAARPLELGGTLEVAEGLRVAAKSLQRPAEVLVDHVIEGPGRRLAAAQVGQPRPDEPLQLLESRQRLLVAALLAAYAGGDVQRLDEPKPTAFATERHDPPQDHVGLVRHVVLQVRTDHVQGRPQVIALAEDVHYLLVRRRRRRLLRVTCTQHVREDLTH